MPHHDIVRAVPLEEEGLTVEELARACAVEPDWVVRHVQAGILRGQGGHATVLFSSVDLVRARQLLRFERDFEANEDLAALVVDLCDEVRRLKAHLRTVS